VFKKQFNKDHGILPVTAVTTIPLSDELREKLIQKLESVTGKRVELECRGDPECLGGVRLDLDGMQLDGTVRRRLDEIRNIQSTHHCNRCEVVLGGDNISGNIHPNLRLQNNENVVEQIKIAATYIGDFIMELHKHFSEVRVHSVSGNHSRMSPNKEEHLSGEELDALIPFFLSIKFENYSDVKICNDGYIDNSINSFVTRNDKLFYIVHGDKDKPSNVTHKLTMMTGKKPDAIIMHHRHHNAYDTQYGVKIVQVGCVVGSDDHCVDLRISGDPEQCVIITSETQAVKCIYDVSLR
jgi:hypothetical protein